MPDTVAEVCEKTFELVGMTLSARRARCILQELQQSNSAWAGWPRRPAVLSALSEDAPLASLEDTPNPLLLAELAVPASVALPKRRYVGEYLDLTSVAGPTKGVWMTDIHMTWAMDRIQRSFVDVEGLQSTLKTGKNSTESACFQEVPFHADLAIQIMGLDSHWVWTAKFQDRIYFGDSLNRRTRMAASDKLIVDMIRLFPYALQKDEEGSERFKYVSVIVQQQTDSYSCGVFCIVALYLMASRTVSPPEMGNVLIDTDLAWGWLLECWRQNALSPPPFRKVTDGYENLGDSIPPQICVPGKKVGDTINID